MKPFIIKRRNRYRRSLYRGAATGAAAALLCLLSACSREETVQYTRLDTGMGTIIRQSLYVEESRSLWPGAKQEEGESSAALDGNGIMLQIMEEMDFLEKEMLSWRQEGSQVYEINAQAGADQGTELSEELLTILKKLWQVSEDSEGALDVTVGEVTRLWNIDSYAAERGVDTGFQIPSSEQLSEALQDTGYEKVTFDENRIYLPEGMELDLGAVGKGIACDRILDCLMEQEKVTGAVISVGGSILTYGEKPDGTPWNVGITNPQDTSSSLGSLLLYGKWCVSTSGDYERYVEVDGVRYHHIMDPAVGYPADSGLSSVTVLGKDGCLADALSTACFVLGEEKGRALLQKYEAEAVFVDHEGRITMTDGMKEYFSE